MNDLGFQDLINSKKLLVVNLSNGKYYSGLMFLGYAFNKECVDFWAFKDSADDKTVYIKREHITAIEEE